MSIRPEVVAFFDPATSTLSYLVRDPGSKSCAIIDPVLDFDYASCRVRHESADRIIDRARRDGLDVEWLIETHVHADHLSAAPYLKEKLGGRIAIGGKIAQVQKIFGEIFAEGPEFSRDGRQFDHLFEDGETYRIGALEARVMSMPGHTPACATHVIGDAAFVGDTLFMPDGGSARADFPGGDARTLFRSIHKILALPPETRIFVCHDYQPDGRDLAWETTVAEQRAHNIHVRIGVSEDDFVAMREARDATLRQPKLIIPSLQVNMKAGRLPEPDARGRRFLKAPLDAL